MRRGETVGKYDGVKVRKPNRKKFPRVAVPKPTRIHKDKKRKELEDHWIYPTWDEDK